MARRLRVMLRPLHRVMLYRRLDRQRNSSSGGRRRHRGPLRGHSTSRIVSSNSNMPPSRQELREVKTTALGRVSLPAAAQGGAVQALALVGPVEPVPALVLRRQELGRARQGPWLALERHF